MHGIRSVHQAAHVAVVNLAPRGQTRGLRQRGFQPSRGASDGGGRRDGIDRAPPAARSLGLQYAAQGRQPRERCRWWGPAFHQARQEFHSRGPIGVEIGHLSLAGDRVGAAIARRAPLTFAGPFAQLTKSTGDRIRSNSAQSICKIASRSFRSNRRLAE